MRAVLLSARLALALAGALAVSAPAAAQTYPFEIAKANPAALRGWRAVLPRDLAKVRWLARFDGVAGPLETVTMKGRAFYYGTICKPHDCGDNIASFLIGKEGGASYGYLVSRDLGVRWFGAPDAEAQKLLKKLLE